MIPGFFQQVQRDIMFLATVTPENVHKQDELLYKVVAAAMRMIGAVGLGSAALMGTTSLLSGGATLLGLTAIVVVYTGSHDLFVMGKNLDSGAVKAFVVTASACYKNFKAALSGRSTNVPHRSLTIGTFYEPIWNHLLHQASQR